MKVKICGITEPLGLQAAIDHHTDFVGFVFHPSSPRAVLPEIATDLIRMLPASIIPVGLFVDPDDEVIETILAHVPLKMIQLHGYESPERTAAIRAHTNLPVMKAIRIASQNDLNEINAYEDSCDWILFDAKTENPAQHGGTGQRFDWAILKGHKIAKPWMLAGGLNPENVGEAFAILCPDAVDVSSGVERAPGEKDPAKIAAFIAAAHTA